MEEKCQQNEGASSLCSGVLLVTREAFFPRTPQLEMEAPGSHASPAPFTVHEEDSVSSADPRDSVLLTTEPLRTLESYCCGCNSVAPDHGPQP